MPMTEIGVVTRSERGLRSVCAEHGADPNDVYVIACAADLRFALRDTEDKELVVIFAPDWNDTDVDRAKFERGDYL